jgi:hypothetical protein
LRFDAKVENGSKAGVKAAWEQAWAEAKLELIMLAPGFEPNLCLAKTMHHMKSWYKVSIYSVGSRINGASYGRDGFIPIGC